MLDQVDLPEVDGEGDANQGDTMEAVVRLEPDDFELPEVADLDEKLIQWEAWFDSHKPSFLEENLICTTRVTPNGDVVRSVLVVDDIDPRGRAKHLAGVATCIIRGIDGHVGGGCHDFTKTIVNHQVVRDYTSDLRPLSAGDLETILSLAGGEHSLAA
jgi:hypothetical protein